MENVDSAVLCERTLFYKFEHRTTLNTKTINWIVIDVTDYYIVWISNNW